MSDIAFCKDTDPFILADGTAIDPNTGNVISAPQIAPEETDYIEVPTNKEAQEIVVRTRRALIDLPEPPEKMNGIALVLAYTMLGLSDMEIGTAIGASIDTVKTIKKLDSFKRAANDLVLGAIEADEEQVRGLLAAHSKNAASKVVQLLASEDEKLQFAAAKDILDRSGHRPADVIEHRHNVDGELRIVHVKANEAPIINVTPCTEVNEDE